MGLAPFHHLEHVREGRLVQGPAPRAGGVQGRGGIAGHLVGRAAVDAGGLHEHHPHAPRGKFLAQGVAEGGQRRLGRVQRAGERRGEADPDRGDHDDAAAGLAQGRQHGLGDGELAGYVDFQLAAEGG